MGDLTKEDQARKEAGDKYFKADSRESLDLAIAGNDWNAGWQAACTYKQKRITELEAFIEKQTRRIVTLIKEGGGKINYIAERTGVYQQGIVGLFSSKDLAVAGVVAAIESEPDDHHDFAITEIEIDKVHRPNDWHPESLPQDSYKAGNQSKEGGGE